MEMDEFASCLYGSGSDDEERLKVQEIFESKGAPKLLLLRCQDDQDISHAVWRYSLSKAMLGARVCIVASEKHGRERYARLDGDLLDYLLNKAEVKLDDLDRIEIWYAKSIYVLRSLLIKILCEREDAVQYLVVDRPEDLNGGPQGSRTGGMVVTLGVVEALLQAGAPRRIVVASSDGADLRGCFDLVCDLNSGGAPSGAGRLHVIRGSRG